MTIVDEMGCPSVKGLGCTGFFFNGLTEVYREILQDWDFRYVFEDFV
jgi:hypothetical protein